VTAVCGLPASCVIVGAAGAIPPGSSCFNSSTVCDSFVKAPPFGSSKACILVTMLPLYSGSFVARSTNCLVSIQPAAPKPVKISATTTSTAAMRPIQRSMRVTSGESKKVSSADSASGISRSRAK
jgi:hypothetical protein